MSNGVTQTHKYLINKINFKVLYDLFARFGPKLEYSTF